MRTTLLVAAMLTMVEFMPRPSVAAIYYPWCAQFGASPASRSCAFLTKAQCTASLGGIGGYCYENPKPPSVYQGSAVPTSPAPQSSGRRNAAPARGPL